MHLKTIIMGMAIACFTISLSPLAFAGNNDFEVKTEDFRGVRVIDDGDDRFLRTADGQLKLKSYVNESNQPFFNPNQDGPWFIEPRDNSGGVIISTVDEVNESNGHAGTRMRLTSIDIILDGHHDDDSEFTMGIIYGAKSFNPPNYNGIIHNTTKGDIITINRNEGGRSVYTYYFDPSQSADIIALLGDSDDLRFTNLVWAPIAYDGPDVVKTGCAADLDGNGDVDEADVQRFLHKWSGCVSAK